MAASTRTPYAGGYAPARTRALAVVLAALAAAAVWLIAGPIGGVAVDARPATGGEPQPVGIAAVLISSLLAGLAGWALLAVLERFTRRAGAVWTVVAVAVLLLSFGGPLTGGATTGATVALLCMHLAPGIVLITVMTRTAARRRGAAT